MEVVEAVDGLGPWVGLGVVSGFVFWELLAVEFKQNCVCVCVCVCFGTDLIDFDMNVTSVQLFFQNFPPRSQGGKPIRSAVRITLRRKPRKSSRPPRSG